MKKFKDYKNIADIDNNLYSANALKIFKSALHSALFTNLFTKNWKRKGSSCFLNGEANMDKHVMDSCQKRYSLSLKWRVF